jgi:hypothetical protein
MSMARSASTCQGCQPSNSRHQLGVGQARGRIVLGVARDRTGLRHRGREAVFAQVGRAGAALALAEIDGDRDAAVARGLHGFHRTHAHVDVEAVLLRAGDFRLRCAFAATAIEELLGDIRQLRQPCLAVIGRGSVL